MPVFVTTLLDYVGNLLSPVPIVETSLPPKRDRLLRSQPVGTYFLTLCFRFQTSLPAHLTTGCRLRFPAASFVPSCQSAPCPAQSNHGPAQILRAIWAY